MMSQPFGRVGPSANPSRRRFLQTMVAVMPALFMVDPSPSYTAPRVGPVPLAPPQRGWNPRPVPSLPADYRAELMINGDGRLLVVDVAPQALEPPAALNYAIHAERVVNREPMPDAATIARTYPTLTGSEIEVAQETVNWVMGLGEDPQRLVEHLANSPLASALAPADVQRYFANDALQQMTAVVNSLHESGLPFGYAELLATGQYDLGAYAALEPTLALMATPENATRFILEMALTTENLVNSEYPVWALPPDHPVAQHTGPNEAMLLHGVLNAYAPRQFVVGTGVMASHNFIRYHGNGMDFYTRILWDQLKAIKTIFADCRARECLPVWLVPQAHYRAQGQLYISRDALILRDLIVYLCQQYGGGLALDLYNAGGRLFRSTAIDLGIDPYWEVIKNDLELHTSVYDSTSRGIRGLDLNRDIPYGSAVFDLGFLQVYDVLNGVAQGRLGIG